MSGVLLSLLARVASACLTNGLRLSAGAALPGYRGGCFIYAENTTPARRVDDDCIAIVNVLAVARFWFMLAAWKVQISNAQASR